MRRATSTHCTERKSLLRRFGRGAVHAGRISRARSSTELLIVAATAAASGPDPGLTIVASSSTYPAFVAHDLSASFLFNLRHEPDQNRPYGSV
jgi:hypothetical protein